jgi:hypothetical protein
MEKSEWTRQHPRRAQLVRRLNRQAFRIAKGFETAKLSAGEALRLLERGKAVRQHALRASAQGGGITPEQNAALNRRLNRIGARLRFGLSRRPA